MEFYKVIDIEKAKKILEKNFLKIKIQTIKVSIFEAIGLKISKDYISLYDLPSFNRSTVDGYAVYSKDTFGASSSFGLPLKLKGKIDIGEKNNIILKEGEALQIMTGSMIPKGCNGIIKIEHTQKINKKEILIFKSIHENENIIFKNEDVRKGQKIFKKGHVLKIQDVVLIGALGTSIIEVEKPISIGVISTGNEILPINNKFILGKIRDINGPLLINYLKQINSVKCFYLGIVKDNFNKLKKEINNALKTNDILLISGGSSIGEKDYLFEIMNYLGKILFHGLAIRPGKPTIACNINNKLIISLPGHPLSCYFVFKNLINPLFMENKYKTLKSYTEGILTKNIPSISGCLEFIPVFIKNKKVQPILGKSGLLNSLCKSNGYIEIPFLKEGFKKGTKVNVFLL